MSPHAVDDLLQPTLTSHSRVEPIYSRRTCFLTSFFGGPMAGAIVIAVNARRLGRLSKDSWLVALGVISAVMMLWWLMELGGQQWLRSTIGRSGPRLANNFAGCAYFAVSSLVHRPFHRNMEFAGIDAPNGWRVGILAVLLAAAVTIPVALLFAM